MALWWFFFVVNVKVSFLFICSTVTTSASFTFILISASVMQMHLICRCSSCWRLSRMKSSQNLLHHFVPEQCDQLAAGESLESVHDTLVRPHYQGTRCIFLTKLVHPIGAELEYSPRSVRVPGFIGGNIAQKKAGTSNLYLYIMQTKNTNKTSSVLVLHTCSRVLWVCYLIA